MSNSEPLSVMSKPVFLLARTAPPSAALQSAAAVQGMQLVHCALVQSQPEPANAALLALLDGARSAEWHVFVSPQAARAASMLVPDIGKWSGRFAAVGMATAEALNLASSGELFCQGKTNVLIPALGEGAQALLDTPDLQQLAGCLIAIYAAPDGLPLLATTFIARGARIVRIPIYRRVANKLNAEQAAQCRVARHAYVGSVAFLEALLAVRGHQTLQVLTPSERVAAAARALGCVAQVCESTSDQAIAAQILA
jgi:uroporphyrinogen-III synthase